MAILEPTGAPRASLSSSILMATYACESSNSMAAMAMAEVQVVEEMATVMVAE